MLDVYQLMKNQSLYDFQHHYHYQDNDGEEAKEIDVGNEEENAPTAAEDVGSRKKRKPLKVNGVLKAAVAVGKQ